MIYRGYKENNVTPCRFKPFHGFSVYHADQDIHCTEQPKLTKKLSINPFSHSRNVKFKQQCYTLPLTYSTESSQACSD